MSVKDSSKGALSPLLLLWRQTAVAAITLLMTACASRTPPAPIFATGYIADRAVVRLWRKDDSAQNITQLVTLSTPLLGSENGQNSVMVETRYQFVQTTLRDIKRTSRGAREENVHLRFTEDGSVSFMQRQLAGRRESVSEDEIALFQFDAKRLLELSDVLRTGNVKQRQGQLQGNRVLMCDGQIINPDFDVSSLNRITQQRQRQPDAVLSIVWLDAHEGTQLLQVTPTDVCQWKPFIGE